VFKKFLSIMAMVLLSASAVPAAEQMTGGEYFFRYRTSSAPSTPNDPGANKDITATYALGVGYAFSAKLPLKPEWEDDSWSYTGSLPAGISFDARSETFSGKATQAGLGTTIEMTGVDSNGAQVATAKVTFDVYTLPLDATYPVNIYAHTGKYSFNALPIPNGITVDHWQKFYPAPTGVTITEASFDGTPTKAGVYPVMLQGFDFTNKPILAFVGNYTVEDGPTFAHIADKLFNVDIQENGPLRVDFYNEPVLHTLPTSATRYFVEVQNGGALPGSVTVDNNVVSRHISGWVPNYYDQASIRYKAVDADGTIGYSNYFLLGTLGPHPVCGNYGDGGVIADTFIPGKVGQALNYFIPTSNSAGTRLATLTGGVLPDGITLNPNGSFVGTPTKSQTQTGILVKIDILNNGHTDQTPICGPYTLDIAPTNLDFSASITPNDFRVGTVVSGKATLSAGFLPGWTMELTNPADIPSTLAWNATNGTLTGPVNVAGSYNANILLTTVDGRTMTASMPFTARDPLKLGDITAIPSIAQYDVNSDVVSVNADLSTVIGAADLSVQPSALPAGMTFSFDGSTGTISGGTQLPPMTYGPYHFKLSDASGQSVSSPDFSIVVTDRKEMVAGDTKAVSFTVKKQASIKPFDATEPPLASDLTRTYALTGPALPAGLTFDPDTGIISGTAQSKTQVDGYTVTVTDSEGKTSVSQTFSVAVVDPTAIPPQTLAAITKNVSTSAFPTFVATRAPDIQSLEQYLVGTVAQVRYTSIEPAISGLVPDLSTGILSGNPAQVFDGDVTVNFEDSAGRPGKATTHLTVLPVPDVRTSQASYDVARLSDARDQNITALPNAGYYGTVNYSLSPLSAPLPTGMSLSGAQIVGTSSVTKKSFDGIIIRAKDNTSGIYADTAPFSINIVDRSDLHLTLTPAKVFFYLSQANMSVTNHDQFSPAPTVTGSKVLPITFAVTDDGGSGLTVNKNTGQFVGGPQRLGTWTVTVTASDSDNPASTAEATVTVRATLDGYVIASPGGQTLADVRIRETFQTPTQVFSNAVGTVTASSSDKPSTLALDSALGSFLGNIANPGLAQWTLKAVDSDPDPRSLQSLLTFKVNVIDALKLDQPGVATNYVAKQYAQPVSIQFAPATNVMGKVSYAVSDNLPGTLVYKTYANDDLSGQVTYAHFNSDGSEQIWTQDMGVSTLPAGMPLDAMIFDTLKLTLTGTPSRSGVFDGIVLTAYDDHANHYLKQNDAHIADDNTASSAAFTINVAPAADLTVSNSASTETVHQYTSQPTIQTTVQNGAYGLPITWSKVAGTLPTKVSAVGNGSTLSYLGYPSVQGSYAGIIYRGTDAAGRHIDAPAISFTVDARAPLQLVASSNPRGIVVFQDDADLTVSAINTPNGAGITPSNWSVTGVSNLPPGVSYTINSGNVHFAGISNVIGTYKNIIVSGTDSLGANASVNLTISVISSTESIVLNVSDIITRIGKPVVMTPPYSTANLSTANTYGNVRFYSNDIASALPGVTINGSTGELLGSVATPTEATFNMFVGDQTARVTSMPIKVTVYPLLRLLVPTNVTLTQGAVANTAINVSYKIGTATYSKGAGSWPDGVSVDPNSGAIVGTPTAATGTYSGLTINGSDQSGDSEASNTFSIIVNPTAALPVIANITNNKLIFGTVGVAATSFKPTVTDSVGHNPWVYAGTVYSLNHNLTADTGLSFDPSTGTISGTPTAAIIYRDLTITVTSQRGDTATTTPFWFGVAPANAIVPTAGQVTKYYIRIDKGYSSNPLLWDNLIGNKTYTPQSGVTSTFNGVTGVYTDGPQGASALAGQPAGGWPATTKVTDEFGRTGSITQFNFAMSPLTVTVPSGTLAVVIGTAVTDANVPSVTGKYGTLSYTATGLPAGLQVSPTTGSISGTVPAGYSGPASVPITVTVTDSYEVNATTATVSYSLTVSTGPITATSGQQTTYNTRVGAAFSTSAPLFYNTIGGVTYTSSALTSGGTFNSATGVITGPYTISGTNTVTITATDSTGRTGTFVVAVNINSVLALAVSSPTTTLNMGQAYTNINTPTVTSLVGIASYTATGLPAGMTISPTTGAISGTVPSSYAGGTTFPVAVTVTDSYDGSTKTASYTLTIFSGPITATAGQQTAYKTRLGAAFSTVAPLFDNTVGGVTYTNSALAPGGSFNGTTGVISGPYTVTGTNTVTITARDSTGRTGTFTVAVTINAAMTMSVPSPTTSLGVGTTYTSINTPTTTNVAGTASYAATGLPPGFTINANGSISGKLALGTPVGQSYPVTVTVTDSYDGSSKSVSYTLTSAGVLQVAPGQKTYYAVRVDRAWATDPIVVYNGVGTVTFAKYPGQGGNIDSSTGSYYQTGPQNGSAVINGQPAGGWLNTAVISDSRGSINFNAYIESLWGLTTSIPTKTLSPKIGTVYTNINVPSSANVYGTASYVVTGLPTGMTFNSATGSISGTIPASVTGGTTFPVTVTVTDSKDGITATTSYTLTATP
jgi:hypothetical protein